MLENKQIEKDFENTLRTWLSQNKIDEKYLKEMENILHKTKNDNPEIYWQYETIKKHEEIIKKPIEKLTIDEFEKHILIEINNQRKKENLKPLSLNRDLCNVAQAHANYMAQDNYGHIDWNLESGKDRIEKSKYNQDKNILCAWENIAYGQRTIKKLVENGWMESSWHRRNILNPDFTEMWIAYKKWEYTSNRWVKYEGLYFCQTFWAKKFDK